MNMHFWQRNFGRIVKCTTALLSVFTMVFSPVALGEEAKKLSQAQIAMAVKDLGLNRSNTTVGQFWDTFKTDMPGYMYEEFERFARENRNMRMPQVSVDSVKSATGEQVPVIRFTHNGKTDTIHFFGESKKYISYNGVVLNESELHNLRHSVEVIASKDKLTKKQHETYKAQERKKLVAKAKMRKDLARFKGYPGMSPQLWKSLSKEKKAAYIVNLRLLWSDARRVLDLEEQYTGKKPQLKKEPKAKKTSFVVPSILKALLYSEVQASTQHFNGSCIVAGYVSSYVRDENRQFGEADTPEGCDYNTVGTSERYSGVSVVTSAISACGNESVACNPIVYGYRGNGQPICISRSQVEGRRNFQRATHFDGPCENFSDDLAQNRHLGSNFDVSAIDREAELNQIESDQRTDNYIQTKNYLQSVLRSRPDNTLADAFNNNVWSQDLDNALVDIQAQFQREINGSIESCTSATGPHEANFQSACEQLQRRWLFTEKFISELRNQPGVCPVGSTYKWTYANTDTSVRTGEKGTSNRTRYTDQMWCVCNDAAQSPAKFTSAGGTCPEGEEPPPPPIEDPPPPVEDPPPPPIEDPPPPTNNDDDRGLPLWAKVLIGLTIVGGVLCLTRTFICKKKKDPVPQCPTAVITNCTTSGGSMNLTACICTHQPPTCVSPQVLINNQCWNYCPSTSSYALTCPVTPPSEGDNGTTNPEDDNGFGGVGN